MAGVTTVKGPITDETGTYYLIIDEATGAVIDKQYQDVAALGPAAQNSTVDERGNLVPPPIIVDDNAAPMPVNSEVTPEVAPSDDFSGGGTGYSSRRGYSPRSYSGGGGGYGASYRPSTGGSVYGEPDQDFFDASVPRYADGTIAPFFGGPPRQPGGVWNTQEMQGEESPSNWQNLPFVPSQNDNYIEDPFKEASYKGGRSLPGPTVGDRAPGSSRSSDGGGGAGSSMGANSALGQKLAGKVRGMAAKIQGGGESSASSDTSYQQQQRQYKRQGRKMDRAYDKYNEALEEPLYLPTRGWVKEQGYKKGTVGALISQPEMMLGKATGITLRDNPLSRHIKEIPMTDIAMILKGSQTKRGLTSKTPQVKVPKILQKQGVEQPKLDKDEKRIVDPSKVANTVAKMYAGMDTAGGAGLPDRRTLLENLATSTKQSALRTQLRKQFEYDPGGAVNLLKNYLVAASGRGPSNPITRARAIHAENMVANRGDELLKLKPEKFDRSVKMLAQELL
jgi:hypothetical protein